MIYFIRSGDFVKIGHCERDPIRRLGKLQIGNPVTLELIGVCEGVRADESAWHGRFDRLRVRGEWFRLDTRLERAIAKYRINHEEWSRNRPALAKDTRLIDELMAKYQHDKELNEGLNSLSIRGEA